ncbi:MAG: alpha/beta fold hydrolase [Gaiellaceae bacterium]
MGRRLVFLLVAVAAVWAPGTARAAVPLAHCGQTVGLECATVTVPLDRSGATPGTIGLHVEMLPSTGRNARGVMFLIAGGPGQGSAGSFGLTTPDAAAQMQQTFPGYTLVAFDNRGTGQSGLINCPTLQSKLEGTAEDFAAVAAGCASSIGPTRQFYATRDHAEDIESVRTALDLGRIGLYGVSYGTKLALAYALAHPGGVDRMILDSTVPTTLPDAFDANVLRQMPGTLRAFCAGGLCRRATRDFAGDVARLANKLEAKPARGVVIAPGGGRKTTRMNGEDLVGLVVDSDLSPGLAVELPAAVHAALGGQTRPLLRLLDLDRRLSELTAEDLSIGLNAATNCADGRFPWSPDTPVSSRRAAIDAAIAALPSGSFGPFGKWAARLGTAFFCEQWPSPSGRTPLGNGPLPNVPVLVLSGGYDLRTPTESGAAVAQLFPQGKLVVVPGVGHSVLGADITGCAQNAVQQWLAGGAVRAACPRVPPFVKVLGAFPKPRVARAAATTASVAGKALRESEASWIQSLFAFSGEPLNPAGVYGGKLSLGKNLTFTLARYSDTPGVAITGKVSAVPGGLPLKFAGTIRVTGASASAGTLRITGNRLVGTLGGRKVSVPF